jgi:hypothetical protein
MLGTHSHIPSTRFLVSLGVFDWQPIQFLAFLHLGTRNCKNCHLIIILILTFFDEMV